MQMGLGPVGWGFSLSQLSFMLSDGVSGSISRLASYRKPVESPKSRCHTRVGLIQRGLGGTDVPLDGGQCDNRPVAAFVFLFNVLTRDSRLGLGGVVS